MKTRLISFLTLGRALDHTKDRSGAYSLRKLNTFQKLGPLTHPVAPRAPASAPPAVEVPPIAQAALFESPAAPAPAEKQATPVPTVKLRPTPTIPTAPAVEEKNRSEAADASQASDSKIPSKIRIVRGLKVRQLWRAAAGLAARPAVGIWRKLRGSAPDIRPRAQAELALEKVTVLRNDLSDADLVVVAVERKPADRREARPESAPSPLRRATARWIKLKEPPEGGADKRSGRVEAAQTPP